jgi:hypothetical protein
VARHSRKGCECAKCERHRECSREHQRAYRERNREALRERQREHQRAYRERNRERNRERSREHQRAYRERNREALRERQRAYYERRAARRVTEVLADPVVAARLLEGFLKLEANYVE